MKRKGILSAVIRKEVRHIMRDRASLLILFIMPVLILLLLTYALSFEVNHNNIKVYNPDCSVEAEEIFSRLDAYPKINIIGRLDNIGEIEEAFASGHTRAVIMYHKGAIDLFVDGSSILMARSMEATLRSILEPQGSIPIRFLYNPSLKKEYMPLPGLVMIIFILVSSIVLGISINKEKAQGSYKLLKLTGVANYQLIAGKAVPYLVITMFHILVIYLVCLYFGVTIVGSLTLFFALCLLYSGCCMALGILIASWFDRPIDVLILCWIILFVPNVFLSGFIFSNSSLEGAIRFVSDALPGTAFITAFRNIAYKGTSLLDNLPYFLLLGGELIAAIILSLVGFRRRIPRC